MGTRVTQLYHDFDVAIDLIAVYLGLPLPLPKYRRRDEAHLELKRMFLGEIADRRAKGEKFDDLVDTLMNATYKDGRPLSDDEIGGMLIGVLFAGQHTSSITAAWTGLELQANPAYLKRVMDEQKAVMAEFNGELTFEALKKVLSFLLLAHPRLSFLLSYSADDCVGERRQGISSLAPAAHFLDAQSYAAPQAGEGGLHYPCG